MQSGPDDHFSWTTALELAARLALIVGLEANVCGAAFGQTIGDEPACRHCRITVRQLMVFGDTAGPGEMPPYVRQVARDDRADSSWPP
jgi:hypothetical protein